MMNEKRLSIFLMGAFIVFFCFGFSGVSAAGSADETLVEANDSFTFKGQPIHPGLVREFLNWESDYRPPITVTLDVGAAYQTNEYFDPVLPEKDGGFSVTLGEGGERFFYKHLGRLNNGIHILHTVDKSTGTGIFQNVMFVRFDIGRGFDRDGVKRMESLHMSVVRVYTLVGSNPPGVEFEGNRVSIRSSAEVVRLTFDEKGR
jgi:hypothetical protein